MKSLKQWTLLAGFILGALSPATAAERPNVLVLLLDDMGWAQPGCYGGKLTPTPNIDALAANGMRFTNGYVSGCVCSPSRVGIMTGRYQARTGHDHLTVRPGSELDIKEVTTAQRMKAAGYRTGIVGKWHLGEGPEYLPAARGFDSSFGTLGNLGEGAPPHFYRDGHSIPDPDGAPVTSPLYRDEAIRFIEQSKAGQPWFLYLSFNAVHSPHVASAKWLEKFKHLPKRDGDYAALISEADEAIGGVMARLRELKLEENTLVFCLSDNGGAAPQSEMGGLRGHKWLVWEGGIRVSWIAQWKGRIPAGRVVDTPVIQLDVLPTALAAAGAEVKPEWQLDGVNLLPLLEGRAKTLPRDALYWRYGPQSAVRQGDWKWVRAAKEMKPMLINLATDPGEQTDLSAREPARAAAMEAMWQKWNATMLPERWHDPRSEGEEARQALLKARKGDGKKKKS
jgi:arylsulfatase A-like enzyme